MASLFESSLSLPAVRQVSYKQIPVWLAAGWRDVRANPAPSLAYGILFGLAGDILLLASVTRPHLFGVAVSGFFLLAPLLAAGLYELSRQTAAGNKPLFIESLQVFRQHGRKLALFGLLPGSIALFWERFSATAFALLGEQAEVGVGRFFTHFVLSGNHTGFFITWLALGGMLALLTFAFSIASVQFIIDRNKDVADAILLSLNAFAKNYGVLLLWAFVIVTLTLLGFATLLFGLVIIMPVLGHASWHAYHDLVE